MKPVPKAMMGKEAQPVAVARPRGPEHGEGAEVGGGHGAHQHKGAQAAPGQKVVGRAVLEPALGQQTQKDDHQKVGGQDQDLGQHVVHSPHKNKKTATPVQAGMAVGLVHNLRRLYSPR